MVGGNLFVGLDVDLTVGRFEGRKVVAVDKEYVEKLTAKFF